MQGNCNNDFNSKNNKFHRFALGSTRGYVQVNTYPLLRFFCKRETIDPVSKHEWYWMHRSESFCGLHVTGTLDSRMGLLRIHWHCSFMY